MRKIILPVLLALLFSTTAFAQAVTTTAEKQEGFTMQSEQKTRTSTSLSLLRLEDGDTKLAAFALPNHTFKAFEGRLKLNVIGAYNPQRISERAYLGAALSLDVIDYKGFKATAYYGVRGYDFNNASVSFNRIRGFGVTIPIEKIGFLANLLH